MCRHLDGHSNPIPRRRKRARSALAILSLAAIGLAYLNGGCTTDKGAATSAKPGSGIAEYRNIEATAERALSRALASLNAVAAQSNRFSQASLQAFSSELNRLQVESLQLRARSQAMQARGDAWFQRWHENLARVQDPQLRALAEKERPALQEHFLRVKQLSLEARESFTPFLSGLRALRNSLEKDPAVLERQSTRDSIQSTGDHGQQVRECLLGIRRELEQMSALLTPAGQTPKKARAI